MTSTTMPSPFRPPPAEPKRAAGGNEFSAAVAKLIERRGHIVVERPPILPRLDPVEEDIDAPDGWRWGWLPRAPVVRGVVLALPAMAVGVLLAWLFTGGPSPSPAGSTRPTPRPARPAALQATAVPSPPAPAETRPAVSAAPPSPERAAPPPAPPADPAPVAAAPPVPAPPPQPLSRDEVREVQARLSALGFAAGPADGVAGPQTQAALRRYADARRLPGRDLDRVLLECLRSEPAKGR